MAKRKQYSEKERYLYHRDRSISGEKENLNLSDPKRGYSFGFVDGFRKNDFKTIFVKEFGRKWGFAYRMGVKRGRKARNDHFDKGGGIIS